MYLIYSETSLQRTPGPQNSVCYREVLATCMFFQNRLLLLQKTFCRVLGYSVIEPKVCQKGSVGKRKEPKNIILEDIMLVWWFGRHWLASVCNAWKGQSTKWTIILFLWFVLVLFVKKKWMSMCNRNFHYFIYISIPVHYALDIFATGKHVNHRDEYRLEIPTFSWTWTGH